MALLNFKFGVQTGLPSTKAPGTIYITRDTKKLFVDNPTDGSTERICLGDFQLVTWTKSDTVTTPATALSGYPLKDANTLYITVENSTGATAMWRYDDSAFQPISNSEEIADIVADIAAINTALSGKAPTNHASSSTTYGAATGSNYGHVKLSDSTSATTAAASGGTAATPKAVKAAYDRGTAGVNAAATAQAAAEAADAKAVAAQSTADGAATAAAKAQEEVDALETVVAGKADKNHASSDTTYGAASTSVYGHTKLSSATNSTSEALAATPKAVKSAYDLAKTANGNAAIAQSTADGAATAAANANSNANGRVSKAGDTMTGALKLSGAPTDDLHAATKAYVDGQAASAKSGAEATAQGYVDALKGTSADAATAITVYGAIAKAAAAGTAASNAQTTANNALPKAGGTMTGFITLHAAPTSNLHAATKKYVDDAKSSAISTVRGASGDASSAATVAGAKKYTDEKVAVVSTALGTLEGKIGNLSNIMNFLGTTTTALSNGSTTAKITIDSKEVTADKGDVVVYGNKEFVFDGSKWAEIGDVSAQATAITNLQNTVGTKPNSPTMDNTLWEEVADLRSDLGESGATAGTGSAFARIKTLETWKSSHATEYTNLEGRVDTLEAWRTSHTGEFNTLNSTVSGHTTAIGATGDAASTTGSIYARIKSLQNNLGASNASAGTGTAFARIKSLEDWKTSHSTQYTNLNSAVSSNTTAINNLTTVLTWGTF